MLAYLFGPLLFGWYGIFLGPFLLVVVFEFGRIVVPWLVGAEDLPEELSEPPDEEAPEESPAPPEESPAPPEESSADPVPPDDRPEEGAT
jgi:hypothetical protein